MRLAAPIAALLMLSACGDGGDSAPDQAATPAPAPGTDAEKQARLASLPAAALNPFAPGLDAAGTLSGTARMTTRTPCRMRSRH